MGKRQEVNLFEKREKDLSGAILSSGKQESDKTPKDESAVDNVAPPKKEVEIIGDEPKILESKIIKEEKQEFPDLFTVKKKVKIRKRQKNLWLKEDNIDLLEKIAKNTDFNEGELVDLLIENFLKSLKIK